MSAVKTPRMVKHRNEEPSEMSQVLGQKQALRDGRKGPCRPDPSERATGAEGFGLKRPSETAVTGLVDRP